MTLLTMVAEAASSISQPVPTSLIANTSASSSLWRTLAIREGRELARRHDWQALVVQHSFTAVALVPQAGALPDDYDHLVPDITIWNRTNNTRYIGATWSNEWMQLQSGFTSGNGWWRIVGGVLNIYPAPTAGDTIEFEYISRNWCVCGDGEPHSTWTHDDDVGVISEELMALGLTWRWLKSKGMDYAEDMASYEREVERAASRDRGLRPMVVGKRHDDGLDDGTPGSGDFVIGEALVDTGDVILIDD